MFKVDLPSVYLFFNRAIFSGKTDNAFKNYDAFVSGKQNFSFQYDRRLVF